MNNSQPRMSLRGLRTFCAAARHESFRKAGEELFITASAVSHQIKSLEAELGQPLFERTSRTLRLTNAGRSMYADTCPLMRQLDDAVLRYRKSEARRVLRVSVQPFFASELFIPKLNAFTAKHPDLDLTVDTSDETAEQLPANADVGIRLFRSPPASAQRIFRLMLIPVGSPEFRRSLRVDKAQRIVSPFPLIVHETRSTAWSDWSAISGIGIPKDATTLRLDSMIAVARAAQQGLGAALVPAALSTNWINSGTLVPLFDQALESDDAYYLISRDDKSSDPDVRVLCDWVLQNFDIET